MRQRAITAALHVFSYRLLAYMAVLLCAGGFTWAMLDNTVLRLVSAGIFSLPMMFVYFTSLRAGRES